MASANRQRIGIWIIAVVMVVGTIGSFVVIILSNQNAQKTQATANATAAAQTAEQNQAADENAQNSVALSGYSARTFNSNVSALTVDTLTQGTGATVTATDTVNVSYFGYLSDGVIFDSSTKKSPAGDTPASLSLSGVIAGWTQGLAGQKVGSVVRLTIPASLAYGTTAEGVIPADSPLEFIIEIHSATAAS
jgi:FKBP-type peptidyl-prolyl cis-trans isomerase